LLNLTPPPPHLFTARPPYSLDPCESSHTLLGQSPPRQPLFRQIRRLPNPTKAPFFFSSRPRGTFFALAPSRLGCVFSRRPPTPREEPRPLSGLSCAITPNSNPLPSSFITTQSSPQIVQAEPERKTGPPLYYPLVILLFLSLSYQLPPPTPLFPSPIGLTLHLPLSSLPPPVTSSPPPFFFPLFFFAEMPTSSEVERSLPRQAREPPFLPLYATMWGPP